MAAFSSNLGRQFASARVVDGTILQLTPDRRDHFRGYCLHVSPPQNFKFIFTLRRRQAARAIEPVTSCPKSLAAVFEPVSRAQAGYRSTQRDRRGGSRR